MKENKRKERGKMRDKIKRLLLVMITVLMTFVNAVPMNVMAKDLSNPDRAAIIKEAEKHEGKPYVYGGNGPDSFDCSGFTKYVFQHSIGFTLERTAEAQRPVSYTHLTLPTIYSV